MLKGSFSLTNGPKSPIKNSPPLTGTMLESDLATSVSDKVSRLSVLFWSHPSSKLAATEATTINFLILSPQPLHQAVIVPVGCWSSIMARYSDIRLSGTGLNSLSGLLEHSFNTVAPVKMIYVTTKRHYLLMTQRKTYCGPTPYFS